MGVVELARVKRSNGMDGNEKFKINQYINVLRLFVLDVLLDDSRLQEWCHTSTCFLKLSDPVRTLLPGVQARVLKAVQANIFVYSS
jgi:hypothetical protein